MAENEFDFDTELKNLPESPGVYLMHNRDGEIIYVGKAKVLKNRVRQYFRKSSNHTPKVLAMVAHIAYFEYIETDSETEALALECNLIKKYRPKYNILLKDDKHYPYIKITINEPYPKIMKVRKLKRDGAKYFGPYVGPGTIKNTIDLIRRLFKPPSCSRRFPEDIGKGRPCLNYHINNCFAPCTGRVSKEEYREIYFEICRFLEGKSKGLVKELTEQMQQASKEMRFEKAAELRDKIKAINEIEERQKIINADKQADSDVISIAMDEKIAFCEVFFIRGGKIIGRESYKISNTDNASAAEILTDFVKQFYQSAEYIPPEILTETEIEDKEPIEEWLRSMKHKKVVIASPQRGEKYHLMGMVHKNAQTALDNHRIKVLKDKEKNAVLDQLKEAAGLEKTPMRIECFDISNIQGEDNVAGMVVFENGKPAKRKYRRFKIKSFEGADDYAAMREVIYRRIQHGREEEYLIENGKMNRHDAKFLPMPDLILLDGGKGHLSTIMELFKMIDVSIPCFGLVKNDRHRTRGLIGNDGEVSLSPTGAVFKLLTYIQDEVHNTAIEYHRKLHGQIKSELEEIPGIGEKRRKALLTKFGSIEKIKAAEREELADCEGMNMKAADAVYDYFRSKKKETGE